MKMNLQFFADEIAGLLSEGTKLTYKDGATTKEVAAVKSIPSIGSDPEKVDVTHLQSSKKAYIKGIPDTDNMEFPIIYQGANFKDIHNLVEQGKAVDWTVTYPDGATVTFTGEPFYKFDGAEVNSAIGFNLGVVVSEGPDFNPAPAIP